MTSGRRAKSITPGNEAPRDLDFRPQWLISAVLGQWGLGAKQTVGSETASGIQNVHQQLMSSGDRDQQTSSYFMRIENLMTTWSGKLKGVDEEQLRQQLRTETDGNSSLNMEDMSRIIVSLRIS